MFSMFGEDIGLLPPKLFSRILLGSKNDPAKRSQIGAHHTSREDILTLLEPVVMAQWQAVRPGCDDANGKIGLPACKLYSTGVYC